MTADANSHSTRSLSRGPATTAVPRTATAVSSTITVRHHSSVPVTAIRGSNVPETIVQATRAPIIIVPTITDQVTVPLPLVTEATMVRSTVPIIVRPGHLRYTIIRVTTGLCLRITDGSVRYLLHAGMLHVTGVRSARFWVSLWELR